MKVVNMAEMKATAPPLANIDEASFEASVEQESDVSEQVEDVKFSVEVVQVKFEEPQVLSAPVEEQFESKRLQKSENAISGYRRIEFVQRSPIVNNDFPSIDNSEQNVSVESAAKVSQSKNNLFQSYPNVAASDLKREKTYDGHPIYRVISPFPSIAMHRVPMRSIAVQFGLDYYCFKCPCILFRAARFKVSLICSLESGEAASISATSKTFRRCATTAWRMGRCSRTPSSRPSTRRCSFRGAWTGTWSGCVRTRSPTIRTSSSRATPGSTCSRASWATAGCWRPRPR